MDRRDSTAAGSVELVSEISVKLMSAFGFGPEDPTGHGPNSPIVHGCSGLHLVRPSYLGSALGNRMLS